MVQSTIICPGCGLSLANQQLEAPNGYHATGECYQKYSELSHNTMAKQDIHFIHQHAVDTYTAQHAGVGMKNITIAFALIGLYFAIEHGLTGKQVQRVHMLLAKQRYKWPSLQPPSEPYSITINDVLEVDPGNNRDKILQKWMLDVWQCWDYQHDWIRNVTKTLLD